MNVSIVIPARNEPLLTKTVENVLENATGNIEVIVMLDGYWPKPWTLEDPRLVVVHTGAVKGMRNNINTAANIASGDFLMKLDGHCMVGKGFDEVLATDCEEDWLCVPSRYSLDGEKWERTRGPVDYLYLTFPYNHDDLYGTGFHGKKWKGERGLTGGFWHREQERKHILLDENIMIQGSCWFMPRQLFFDIDCLDTRCYNIHQEATELCFKVWLSGGKVIRNKKTWYAHLHKGKKWGRGFRLSKKQMVESELFTTDYWMNNRWPKQIRPLKWLIDRFWPLEGWPEDWEHPKYAREYQHPRSELLDSQEVACETT